MEITAEMSDPESMQKLLQSMADEIAKTRAESSKLRGDVNQLSMLIGVAIGIADSNKYPQAPTLSSAMSLAIETFRKTVETSVDGIDCLATALRAASQPPDPDDNVVDLFKAA
jgi:hypothetical protein